MTIALALREDTWAELVATLGDRRETAGFLLAGTTGREEADLTLLGRELRWVREDSYLERTARRMSIASSGVMPALRAAHKDQAVVIFVHTHPGMAALPSRLDDEVDASLQGPARLRSRQPFYASLVVGGTPEHPHFTGRVYDAAGAVATIDRLRVVGRHLRILLPHGAGHDLDISSVFDRQVRAFGREGQRLLNQLRVGVVGLGGTGSAVCEQLARLGVKDITLVDDQQATDTNITRIHESRLSDVDERKTTIAARAVADIGLGTRVQVVDGRVTDEAVARQLRHLDVVFGCTDDQAGRAVLTRLAIWYLIPTIDMGFLITSNEAGGIEGLYGRVTLLQPEAACLLCRQHITPEGIRVDGLPSEERKRLAAEGYAPGLPDPDPAVGTYTTLTAMFALNMLLERLIGYGADAGASTELILRLHDLALSRNSRPSQERHFCGNPTKWGRGDVEPFLEKSW
jgi:molybdopterin/thiamine biosynthesis adenylyltransferase/proteasome lid subunit RPN8/RPN11